MYTEERGERNHFKVVRGEDVLAVLPMGIGKSLCYFTLPLLIEVLREDSFALPTIIIVVTPLTALMKDQVKRYLFNFCANSIKKYAPAGSNSTNQGRSVGLICGDDEDQKEMKENVVLENFK